MYQPVGYYDYQRREGGKCCCLLLLIAFIGVVSIAFVFTTSSDIFKMPVTSLLGETELSMAFNDFVRDYDRSYASDAVMQYRKEIFAKNYKIIKQLNEQDSHATFEVNQFADLTDEEFETQYLDRQGANEKCTVAQEYAWEHQQEPIKPNEDIEIDWVKKGMVQEVKNQGSCGSCWTFATMSVIETIYAIRENKLIRLGEQQIVDCCRKPIDPKEKVICPISSGCKGGLVSEGFQYAIEKGVMLEKDYPYKARDERCKHRDELVVFKPHGFVDIKPSDIKAMEKILETRSFAVGLAANHPTFRFYKDGVVDKNCPETPLNHGVTVVGAGTLGGIPYWLVRNSWGKTWGDNGYIRIGRGIDRYPTGVCGIASCPEYIEYKEP